MILLGCSLTPAKSKLSRGIASHCYSPPHVPLCHVQGLLISGDAAGILTPAAELTRCHCLPGIYDDPRRGCGPACLCSSEPPSCSVIFLHRSSEPRLQHHSRIVPTRGLEGNNSSLRRSPGGDFSSLRSCTSVCTFPWCMEQAEASSMHAKLNYDFTFQCDFWPVLQWR